MSADVAQLPPDLTAALRRARLVGDDALPKAEPLSGGVSCDTWRVSGTRGAMVVKQALPRLRVAAAWHAPVDRAGSEVRWLTRARALDARQAPEVLATFPAQHAFAIRYVTNAPVWKDELSAGRVDAAFAADIGRRLARIHAATVGELWVPDTMAFFVALRVDPFLRYVAERLPEVATPLQRIADDLTTRRTALIHGDVSPKNILVAADGPVFLDAECATMGDPAFDLAFCTTHLLLKAVWRDDPRCRAAASALVAAYIAEYADDTLPGRAGALTAALLLARIEGKSPVPYLTDPAQRAHVRDAAIALLLAPMALPALIETWRITTA